MFIKSLEAKKMADWSAKMTKIEEIARKKDELNNEFINQTKEALDAKMEQCVEKRDAIITEVKEKLKVCYCILPERGYLNCTIRWRHLGDRFIRAQ